MWSTTTSTCCYSLISKSSKESNNCGAQYSWLKSVKMMQLGSTKLVPSSRDKCGKIMGMASPTVSSPRREKDPKKRIVITGMGVVSVFGSDIDTYYNKLLDGESGITQIDRFDVSDYPVRFGGQIRGFSSEGYIDEEVDRGLDECWRYCMVAGKKALHDANLGKQALRTMDKSRMGVLVGSGIGGMPSFSNEYEMENKIKAPFRIPYSLINTGSALLAIDSGLMGPNYCISTACATSNNCFIAAANEIRQGKANVMVAGGVDAAVVPLALVGFIATRALSMRNEQPHKASRPWDKNRDGFILGEGAAILIMESLDHAMRREGKIYAEYLGGGITSDAHHMTNPHPDGFGVSTCILKSLIDAGVAPEEVNYVNAHATSTPAGDIAEIRAIKSVFKNTCEMKINATKSMIGHGIGAAGGLEAIATIKAINTGWLHPTINQYELEPEVTIDTVPNVKQRHEINVAISNSFGFGGHNSVVVLAPFKP